MEHVPPASGVEGFASNMTAEWLREIGFTDREIAVCSLLWADGLSSREVAEHFELSHTQVRRYRMSAEAKLRAVGVTVPKPPRGRKPKTRKMDGRLMARRFTDQDKYNAR